MRIEYFASILIVFMVVVVAVTTNNMTGKVVNIANIQAEELPPPEMVEEPVVEEPQPVPIEAVPLEAVPVEVAPVEAVPLELPPPEEVLVPPPELAADGNVTPPWPNITIQQVINLYTYLSKYYPYYYPYDYYSRYPGGIREYLRNYFRGCFVTTGSRDGCIAACRSYRKDCVFGISNSNLVSCSEGGYYPAPRYAASGYAVAQRDPLSCLCC